MAKKKRGKRKATKTGHSRSTKNKHKRPVPEAFKAQWARNKTKSKPMAKKRKHTKRKHAAKPRRTRRSRHASPQAMGLMPTRSELYDLAGTAAFAAAERKAAAEPTFFINSVPRPIDAIGWAGNIALAARVAAYAARKVLPAAAKPLKHFAIGAGHVAAYQLMRHGKLFDAGAAAAPVAWIAPPADAPAAGTAPPAAANSNAAAPSSSEAATRGYDDDELDMAGLAADYDDEDELAGDDEDDEDELAGDDGVIDVGGLPFDPP
jgi:hypothetical protein